MRSWGTVSLLFFAVLPRLALAGPPEVSPNCALQGKPDEVNKSLADILAENQDGKSAKRIAVGSAVALGAHAFVYLLATKKEKPPKKPDAVRSGSPNGRDDKSLGELNVDVEPPKDQPKPVRPPEDPGASPDPSAFSDAPKPKPPRPAAKDGGAPLTVSDAGSEPGDSGAKPIESDGGSSDSGAPDGSAAAAPTAEQIAKWKKQSTGPDASLRARANALLFNLDVQNLKTQSSPPSQEVLDALQTMSWSAMELSRLSQSYDSLTPQLEADAEKFLDDYVQKLETLDQNAKTPASKELKAWIVLLKSFQKNHGQAATTIALEMKLNKPDSLLKRTYCPYQNGVGAVSPQGALDHWPKDLFDCAPFNQLNKP